MVAPLSAAAGGACPTDKPAGAWAGEAALASCGAGTSLPCRTSAGRPLASQSGSRPRIWPWRRRGGGAALPSPPPTPSTPPFPFTSFGSGSQSGAPSPPAPASLLARPVGLRLGLFACLAAAPPGAGEGSGVPPASPRSNWPRLSRVPLPPLRQPGTGSRGLAWLRLARPGSLSGEPGRDTHPLPSRSAVLTLANVPSKLWRGSLV